MTTKLWRLDLATSQSLLFPGFGVRLVKIWATNWPLTLPQVEGTVKRGRWFECQNKKSSMPFQTSHFTQLLVNLCCSQSPNWANDEVWQMAIMVILTEQLFCKLRRYRKYSVAPGVEAKPRSFPKMSVTQMSEMWDIVATWWRPAGRVGDPARRAGSSAPMDIASLTCCRPHSQALINSAS